MILLTAEEMQKADERAIDLGMPGLILMETAGRSAAARIYSHWQDEIEGGILIAAGGGNNGGDGLVAARYLQSWGADLSVLLLSPPSELEGINAQNYRLCQIHGVHMELAEELEDEGKKLIEKADIIVDAMLGTGLKGPVRGEAARIIEHINSSSGQVLAIDIPSGVNASTGGAPGGAVKADLTVTMQNAKVGQIMYPGRSYCGELFITDLGFPGEVYEGISPDHFRLTDREAEGLLPAREETGHKGTFGEVLVIAGSNEMPGAAVLSSLSALRGGAGLVRLAAPEGAVSSLPAAAPEVVLLPLAGGEEKAKKAEDEDIEKVLEAASDADVVAAGPGLGQSSFSKELVGSLLSELSCPLVLDADGINNLDSPRPVREYEGEIILTPHPGEVGRLLDRTPGEIVDERRSIARCFARENDAILVLKGADTITALPAGELFINPTGNEGMATAGSGDVLTGLMSGLIAQGAGCEEAACLAVYLHGRAGDLALEKEGSHSLTAGDIMRDLSQAFNSLGGEYSENMPGEKR